ncbi:PIN domain-containing protein [Rhodoplanes elegans]|nr:PIN domain-containing protein [Rhodoplanes elegans]
MYVLDTDVLSLTSPTSAVATKDVEAWRHWVIRNHDHLYFSVVTVMEVRFGIAKCIAKGATAKAGKLQRWLTATETIYGSRIIPVSVEIARKAGELLYAAVGAGTAPSSEDAIVAATASVNGFQLLSRNGRHMAALGVDWLDPIGPRLADLSS